MALFLVQHGISDTVNNVNEKVLTEKGITETKLIADVARGYSIQVDKIVHSGKKRAEQTAALYHQALSVTQPILQISGLAPLDDVPSFAERIDGSYNTMIVGHMPFLQKLVSYLATGTTDVTIYQFQNSGIVCLDNTTTSDGTLDWFIKWTLNPNIS